MTPRDFLAANGATILQKTNEHLALVVIAMLLAIGIGVPLGIAVARRPTWQRPVLTLANITQTIPSLALFGFLLPILGLGAPNAIAALVLYSLLPIIRNTVTGIAAVDARVREAAVAMGMTNSQILRQVELPLAAGVMLAGIRTATVLCVGITTIASFIGAGGLGEFIQNGLRANDNLTTLAGALPAALLALGADAVLGTLQRSIEIPTARNHASKSRWTKFAVVPAVVLLVAGVIGAGLGARSLFNLAPQGVMADSENVTISRQKVVVASKDFTESRLLAEIVAQLCEANGVEVTRKGSLGGNLCHTAMLADRIDVYPEYTGTAFTDILKHKPQSDVNAVYNTVKTEYAEKFDVTVGQPLGFSNGFAMLIRGADARQLGIKTLSEAVPYAPRWKAGFGPDFITRADGYPGLAKTYGLKFSGAPRSMDLSLINRALASKQVDIIAGNETDGLIPTLDLFQLRDDKNYFPPYQGVYIVRTEALRASPSLKTSLDAIAGKISTSEMQKLNYEVDGKKRDVKTVVRDWLAKQALAG